MDIRFLRNILKEKHVIDGRFEPFREITNGFLVAKDYEDSCRVAGRRAYMWVTEDNSPLSLFQAFSPKVQDRPGLPVKIAKSPKPPYMRMVIDVDWDTVVEQNYTVEDEPYYQQHSATHEFPDTAPGSDVVLTYPRAIVPMGVRISSGMIVTLSPGVYMYRGEMVMWLGSSYDLTGNLPSAGNSLRVLLYYDPKTDEVYGAESTEVVTPLEPDYLVAPVGTFPLGWVLLTSDTTAITNSMISDPRAIFSGGEHKFVYLLDVPTDYSGYGGYMLTVSEDEDGILFTTISILSSLWSENSNILSPTTVGNGVDIPVPTASRTALSLESTDNNLTHYILDAHNSVNNPLFNVYADGDTYIAGDASIAGDLYMGDGKIQFDLPAGYTASIYQEPLGNVIIADNDVRFEHGVAIGSISHEPNNKCLFIYGPSTAAIVKLYGGNDDGVRLTMGTVDGSGYSCIYAWDENDGGSAAYTKLYIGSSNGSEGLTIDPAADSATFSHELIVTTWTTSYYGFLTGGAIDLDIYSVGVGKIRTPGYVGITDLSNNAQDLAAKSLLLSTSYGTTPGTGELWTIGSIFVGDTYNGDSTLGITLNQGANDDAIVTLKSSDVAHGMTSVCETDTYAMMRKYSGAVGGLSILALMEDSSGTYGWGAFNVFAYIGEAAGTSKSTSGHGIARISCYIKSGTSGTTVTANGNLFSVENAGSTRFILDADGDSHQDVGTLWTNFDEHDDIALVTGVCSSLDRIGNLKLEFGHWLDENKLMLEELGIVTFNDDGHHFIDWSKWNMLLGGAVRQLAARLERLESVIL